MSKVSAILDAAGVLEGISLGFLVLSTISTGLRVWTRWRLLRQFGIDDHFAILAWICLAITVGFTMWLVNMIRGSLAGHIPNWRTLGVIVKLDLSMYIASMMFLKLSLCFFFLRIFTVQKIQRNLVIMITALTMAYSILYLCISNITCGPNANFVPGVNASTCQLYNVFQGISISWSYLNAVGDLFFSALATNALWAAQMSRRMKFTTSFVLLLGTSGGIASTVRAIMLPMSASDQNLTGLHNGYMTIMEVGIGVTAASLATLRPLIRQFRKKGSTWVRSTLGGTKASRLDRSVRGGTLLSEHKMGGPGGAQMGLRSRAEIWHDDLESGQGSHLGFKGPATVTNVVSITTSPALPETAGIPSGLGPQGSPTASSDGRRSN